MITLHTCANIVAHVKQGNKSKHMSHLRYNKLILIIVLLFAMASCDEDREHPVPYVHVNFEFNVIHYNLSGPGSSHQFSVDESGGYRGIIVHRLTMDEFRAYDRACPCDPNNCMVSIDPENPLLATDPCCGSTFLLLDGTIVEGDARFPLREYRASFNPATNRLRITN